MTENRTSETNKTYIFGVTAITFVLPVISALSETGLEEDASLSFGLLAKWFIFYAVGLRLFLAGIRQIFNPAFTAQQIFHINTPEVYPILRELGFANVCFGLIGLLSLFLPDWRFVSAFGSGIYYGLAALQHFFKKPSGTNERFALITDIIIFFILIIYVKVVTT